MEYSKSFFGKATIDSSDSEDISDDEKIELEYYKTHNVTKKDYKKFGIEVLKRDVNQDEFNIETKIVNNISSEENTISRLLEILMINKVTPISVDDVISDISVLD